LSNIIRDLNSRLAFLGWTKQELADKVHKEVSTVSKQMDPKNSNLQLSTLEMYAEILGGELAFLTPESIKAMQDADVTNYRDRLIKMDTELEYLQGRVRFLEKLVEEKKEEIARRDAIITEKERVISRKDAIIEEKDRTIERKDKRLAEFIDELRAHKN